MENKSDQKNSKIMIIRIVGVIFVVVAVILAIWFLLNGEKTVTGGYPATEKATALSCTKRDETYSILDSKIERTDTKDLKIDAIFNGQELNSIALSYMLYYGNNDLAATGEAKVHAAMNDSFNENELSPDSLGANYNKMQNNVKMTLYATRSELNDKTAKYFLLDFSVRNPLTLDSMKKHYEGKEFKCDVNDK